MILPVLVSDGGGNVPGGDMPCVWVGGRCGYTKHSIRGVRVKLHVTTNQPTSHIQCIDVERCMSDHLHTVVF